LYKEGKCEDFIAVNEEAIKIVSRQKDPVKEGNLHYNVAECYALLNKYEGAVKHLDRAIDIAGRTNNPELEILSFIGKNRVLIVSGDRKNAAEIFRKISEKADREVFLNIAAPDSLKAMIAFQMTHVLLDIDDGSKAREMLDYALLVNHDFKMEDDIIGVLKVVNAPVYEEIAGIDRMLEDSWASYEKGDYKSMERYSRQSLDSAKKMYYKRGIFNGNYYLAMSLANLGESRDAMSHVQNARELAEKGNDALGLGMVYNLMGNIFKQENEHEKALYYANKYLEVVKKLGDRDGEAVALNNIGNVMMDKGEYEQALKYYEDSLKIILSAGTARHLMAQGYLSLGRAQKKLGDYNKAGESIAQAKNIFSELGNVGGELTGLWEMAGNYGLQGEYGPAIKILEDNLTRSEGIGLRQNFVDDLISYAEKSNDSERSEKYRKLKGN
jgi:tetratricopeptide (TPR) repeat protein